VAIIGLSIAVVVPLTSEQVRRAKARGAADEFAANLKAARMIAVTKHATVSFVVTPDPTNTYRYPAVNGVDRTFALPAGVRITSPSSETTIAFQSNGSVTAANTTVMEANLTGTEKERFTVTTGVTGVPVITRQRVSS